MLRSLNTNQALNMHTPRSGTTTENSHVSATKTHHATKGIVLTTATCNKRRPRQLQLLNHLRSYTSPKEMPYILIGWVLCICIGHALSYRRQNEQRKRQLLQAMQIAKLTTVEGPAIGAGKILRILEEQNNLRSHQQSSIEVEEE